VSPNTDIVDRFKDDLLAASAPASITPRRRRWYAVPTMAAAAVAVAVALAALPSGKHGPRPGTALAITDVAGGTRVRIADASASAERVERELGRAGITASVGSAPVSPSLVGTWTTVSGTPALRDAASEDAEIGHGVDLNVPRGYAGRLKLRIGRTARPGEDLRLSSSAFAEGEPLHCSGVERLDGRAADAEIRRRDLLPRWEELQKRRVVETLPGRPDRVVEATVPVLVDTPPPGRIIDARLLSRGYPEDYGRADGRTLLVRVVPEDSALPPEATRGRIPDQRCR
jgi:hypothetical protein